MGKPIVLCWRVDTPGYIVPSSTKVTCQDCGTFVWLAPSSQKAAADGGVTVVCIECGLKRIKQIPENERKLEVFPGLAQEVDDYQKRN